MSNNILTDLNINDNILQEYNISLEDIAIIRLRKRQKDLNEYNCYCLKTLYNQDFIDKIHANNFDNFYIKKTKERAINADIHNIEYVLNQIENIFSIIIIENKLTKNILINGYKKLTILNGYTVYQKEKYKIKNGSDFLLNYNKKINVDTLLNVLETKLKYNDYIQEINIILGKEKIKIESFRPYFYTNFKKILIEIRNSKEYNPIYVLFNVEYGIVDSIYYEYSGVFNNILKEYKKNIEEFEKLKNKPIVFLNDEKN